MTPSGWGKRWSIDVRRKADMKYEIWFYDFLCVVLWVRENTTLDYLCGACNERVIYEGIN